VYQRPISRWLAGRPFTDPPRNSGWAMSMLASTSTPSSRSLRSARSTASRVGTGDVDEALAVRRRRDPLDVRFVGHDLAAARAVRRRAPDADPAINQRAVMNEAAVRRPDHFLPVERARTGKDRVAATADPAHVPAAQVRDVPIESVIVPGDVGALDPEGDLPTIRRNAQRGQVRRFDQFGDSGGGGRGRCRGEQRHQQHGASGESGLAALFH
jgi:hypothetical protein